MSDTPLTDAEMCDGWSGDAFAVSVEFSRQLEKQLAERDAALARCVEALREIRIVAHTAGGIPLKAMFDDLLASLPTSAQATAKVLAAARELVEAEEQFTFSPPKTSADRVCEAKKVLREAIREEQEDK